MSASDEESQAPELARVSTGVRGLDMIMQGGLLRGGLYIVSGSPGSGKTTLGNQFCFANVKSGGTALYVTLRRALDAVAWRVPGSVAAPGGSDG